MRFELRCTRHLISLLSSHAHNSYLSLSPDPRFYTKRTYLRRTRKVFTRGKLSVCVTLGPIYISARNLSPSHARTHASTYIRAHAHNFSLRGPQKINRIEPFLQIQIAGKEEGREKPRRLVPRDPLSRSSLFDFRKLFGEPYKTQLATDRRSAVKTRNSIPVIERERALPRSRDRSSFSDFSGARRGEGVAGLRGNGVTMKK